MFQEITALELLIAEAETEETTGGLVPELRVVKVLSPDTLIIPAEFLDLTRK